ncbi:hypothetical protein HMPREF1544_05147 [Mucor circinelloides 1006PhL]|uniref:F-box domain-containing protein n=1 Tax=Mucor circinelloides f. circinelloides (strain 1006PhL) TaxID=1220926 RepID=S2K780_MUCC1|nr:hypothetical protein HMPREF1544_05147 [Mucor circinelloides 1006PhL]
MWDALPLELYLRIVHFIEEPLQIKECRLVCKSWDHPDLKYMQLVSNIVLTTIEDTQFFYKYMNKHPTKARFIRKIVLVDVFHWNHTFLALMDLVITPHLQVLQGQLPYNEELFYAKLNTILASTPAAPWKLLVFPENKLFSWDYFKALVSLKKSIEIIHLDLYHCTHNTRLDIDKIITHMIEFPRLTKLSLTGQFTFQKLVDLLQACHHLVDLYLEPQLPEEQGMLQPQVPAIISQFKVLNTLKTLRIGKYAPIHVIQYLVFVYPDVELVAVNAPWYYSGSIEATLGLLKVIRKVLYYEMNCIIDDRDNTKVDSIISFIKRDRSHAFVRQLDDINRPEITICSRYIVY